MGPPSFGYLIGIPNDDILVFLNECGYQMTCQPFDNYNNCENGCEIFNNNRFFIM